MGESSHRKLRFIREKHKVRLDTPFIHAVVRLCGCLGRVRCPLASTPHSAAALRERALRDRAMRSRGFASHEVCSAVHTCLEPVSLWHRTHHRQPANSMVGFALREAFRATVRGNQPRAFRVKRPRPGDGTHATSSFGRMTGRRLLWLLPCVACTAAGERSPTRLGATRSWEERWAGAGQHIVRRSLWAAVRAVPLPYALRWSQHVVDAVNRGGADKRAAAFGWRCVVGRVRYRLTCGTHCCHRERGAASRSLLSDCRGMLRLSAWTRGRVTCAPVCG